MEMESRKSKKLRKRTYDEIKKNMLKEGISMKVVDKTVEILDKLTWEMEYKKLN